STPTFPSWDLCLILSCIVALRSSALCVPIVFKSSHIPNDVEMEDEVQELGPLEAWEEVFNKFDNYIKDQNFKAGTKLRKDRGGHGHEPSTNTVAPTKTTSSSNKN
ncbi:hypothetical protein L9F63_020572, partial [Diploptera punctata]